MFALSRPAAPKRWEVMLIITLPKSQLTHMHSRCRINGRDTECRLLDGVIEFKAPDGHWEKRVIVEKHDVGVTARRNGPPEDCFQYLCD
jgi:hypothetical protein